MSVPGAEGVETRVTNLLTDVRIALRQWQRHPGMPLAVVSTLTAGLGVAIGVFAVAWAVLWRPFDAPEPQRLVWIESQSEGKADGSSPGAALTWQAEAGTLDGLAFARAVAGVFADGAGTDRLPGALVSAQARLLSGLGFAGVALAMIGLFAAVHHQVHRRRRDIAIRMALGATSVSVVRALVREGARLAAIGALAGGAISIVTGGLLASLLFGVGPGDPVTLATMAVLIVAMASLAAWLPARSAARVDPAAVLRT